MRINVAVPEANVNPEVLNAALEAVTRLNTDLVENRQVPPFRKALAEHGIQWKPEPPGQEHFDHAGIVLGRRAGDCDDLAPYHAASLRATGEDPEASAVVVKSGPKRWHAVVKRSDGSIDDPSAEAGMHEWGKNGNRGATLPMLSTRGESSVVGAYRIRPQIALRPAYGIWQARADLPWHFREHEDFDPPTKGDFAMAALHSAPVAQTALTGCISGLIDLAETAGFGDEEHLDRLAAIQDAVEGADWYELERNYGPDHATAATAVVGSFWGSLKRITKKAMPFVSKAVSFIPGVGPVASTALDVATHFLPGEKRRGGGAPPGQGPTIIHPGAPPGARQGQLCIPATFG